MNLAGNIVSFCEEASVKIHHQRPTYNLLGERSEDHKPFFTIECVMTTYKGQGKGQSKKVAKIIAVKELLKNVIDDGQQSIYGIPGKTKEECLAFIQKLFDNSMKQSGSTVSAPLADLTTPIPTSSATPNENYVGLLQEYCQKNKIPAPSYEYKESGPDNLKIFEHICKVNNQSTESEDKTKKKSKNDAARKMYELLKKSVQEGGKDNVYTEPVEKEEADEEFLNEKPDRDIYSLDNANALNDLKDLIKTTKILSTVNYEFKEISELDNNGQFQTILKIAMKIPGEATESIFCFCGYGETMEQAHVMAANHALLLLETYNNATPPAIEEVNLISF